ncbi:hypothetical protein AB5N19_05902 [Seiridium cardinale]
MVPAFADQHELGLSRCTKASFLLASWKAAPHFEMIWETQGLGQYPMTRSTDQHGMVPVSTIGESKLANDCKESLVAIGLGFFLQQLLDPGSICESACWNCSGPLKLKRIVSKVLAEWFASALLAASMSRFREILSARISKKAG